MTAVRNRAIGALRALARRFPGVASSRFGRAVSMGAREFLLPNQAGPWRGAPITAPAPQAASSLVMVGDPDAVTPPHGPLVEPIQGAIADVVLCCAFTGRHKILLRSILETKASEVGVRWMLCGSTEADREFIELSANLTGIVSGFTCDNDPLGRKWQSCVAMACETFEFALLGIVGSDDIASHRMIDHVVRSHTRAVGTGFAPDLHCTLEWIIHLTQREHPLSPNIFRCHYTTASAFQPLGAGRFYSRAFLDRCKRRIFDSRLSRLLDDRGFEEIRRRSGRVTYHAIEDAPLVSVKGDWDQMNGIEACLDSTSVELSEYSFAGLEVLRRSVSRETLAFLMKGSRPVCRFLTDAPDIGVRELSEEIDSG